MTDSTERVEIPSSDEDDIELQMADVAADQFLRCTPLDFSFRDIALSVKLPQSLTTRTFFNFVFSLLI